MLASITVEPESEDFDVRSRDRGTGSHVTGHAVVEELYLLYYVRFLTALVQWCCGAGKTLTSTWCRLGT